MKVIKVSISSGKKNTSFVYPIRIWASWTLWQQNYKQFIRSKIRFATVEKTNWSKKIAFEICLQSENFVLKYLIELALHNKSIKIAYWSNYSRKQIFLQGNRKRECNSCSVHVQMQYDIWWISSIFHTKIMMNEADFNLWNFNF